MAKGPKFLNPADKARKEARKKELKKNKKQREQVRSAAIKGRDPEQILVELENLDKLEYDPKNCEQQQQQPAVSNMELIYKDKRKRLKELLQRILLHYQKEEPERYEELKKLETEYEVKHKRLEKEYTAIRAAKEVKIDEVFLPPEAAAAINLPGIDDYITDDDPLMSESIYITPLTEGVMPPGCPQGPPPDLECLIDSLKDNLSLAQLMANTHIPPPNLPMPNIGTNNGRYNQRRGPPPRRPPANQPVRRQKPTTSDEAPPESSTTNKQSSDSSKPTEVKKAAAVIESKPIIFVPKATKFVPASVRSKLAPKARAKDK